MGPMITTFWMCLIISMPYRDGPTLCDILTPAKRSFLNFHYRVAQISFVVAVILTWILPASLDILKPQAPGWVTVVLNIYSFISTGVYAAYWIWADFCLYEVQRRIYKLQGGQDEYFDTG